MTCHGRPAGLRAARSRSRPGTLPIHGPRHQRQEIDADRGWAASRRVRCRCGRVAV